MKPVIICGGAGTKMWPLSRRKMPKHFVPLFEGKSLFQINYRALLLQFRPEEIYVQTTQELAKIGQQQAPKIPKKNFFIEPEMRNHGPAMGFMAAKLALIDPDEPFIIVQADVLREPAEQFIKMINYFEKIVLKEKKLITGGLRPEYAVLGVDYLIAKKLISSGGGVKVFKMEKWLSRDTKENIEKYFENSHVFLHANHYCWTPKLLIESYKKVPSWHQPLKNIIKAFGRAGEDKIIAQEYGKMEKAPAEKIFAKELEKGYIAEIPFNWIDFGTWESLSNYFKKQGKGKADEILEIESTDCYVKKEGKKHVSLIGVKNLIVVDTKDSLLVCRQNKSGLVGEVVKILEKQGKKELL